MMLPYKREDRNKRFLKGEKRNVSQNSPFCCKEDSEECEIRFCLEIFRAHYHMHSRRNRGQSFPLF